MESIKVYYSELGTNTDIYHKVIVYTDSSGNHHLLEAMPSSPIEAASLASLGMLAGVSHIAGGYLVGLSSALLQPIETNYINNGSTLSGTGLVGAPFEIIAEAADLSLQFEAMKEAMDFLDGNFQYMTLAQNSNTSVDFALNQAGLPAPQLDGFLNYWSPGSGGNFVVATVINSEDVQQAIEYAKSVYEQTVETLITDAQEIQEIYQQGLQILGQKILQLLPAERTMLLDGIQTHYDSATSEEKVMFEDTFKLMLRDDVGLEEEEGGNLSDWAQSLWDKLLAALGISSPLVLDLSENGTGVELVAQDSADAVYFDLNGDGFATATGWVTANAGFLVYDADESGAIENGTEMFGDQTGFANGFLALADHDSNTDDVINSGDNIWDDLQIWVDANGNGYSEEDELHTLGDFLITEIDLSYTNVDYTIADNQIWQESTFTMDGQSRDILDVYFTNDSMNTGYVDDITLDMSAFELPSLRGYGQLPQLSLALMLDNDTEDADSLMSLMTALSESDYETLGVSGDPQQFYAAVEKVMLRWAGVDGVDPDSRGQFIDARYLEFVEQITGQDFTQLGGGANPLAGPAPVIMEAFGTAHQAVAARLAYQLMDGHALFDDAPLYNPVTDTFGDSTGVDFDALETFLTHTDYLDHLTAARLAVSWTEEIIGFGNLSTQEVLDFEALLPQNVTLAALLADPQYSIGDSGGFLYGDANDNFMVTPLTLEENVPGFSAGAGNDLLITGPADQTVYGYDGNDTIIAGTGRQMMYGYGGDDLYVFAPGMAQVEGSYYNRVQENIGAGTDTLRITGGVDPDDVYTWTGSYGYMYVQYTPTDIVQIYSSISGGATTVGQRLEKITFDDETEWNLAAGLFLRNNSTAKTFNGSLNDDVIITGTGGDTVYGHAGNDSMTANTGRDRLYGGAGDDTYVFAEGAATVNGSLYSEVNESLSSGTDTLYLTGGVEAADVTMWTDVNGHLYVQFTENDIVRVYSSTLSGATRVGEYLERIVLDDETEWDLTGGLTLKNSDTNATVKGTSYNDVIEGGAGSATLYGYDGNDTLKGGATGADKLYGGDGDDVLVAGGGAADWLYGGNDADVFKFMGATAYDGVDQLKDFDALEGDGIDIADVLDAAGFDSLQDDINNFVNFTESGGHTTIQIDRDGTDTGYGFTDIARIDNTIGLVLEDMITNGELLIA